MSYETLKKLTVNLKELKVKYAYSSSNVRDWRDRIIVNEVEREFESKEKLEDLSQDTMMVVLEFHAH
jgi:hypothetical protein